jgi:hypothetical protein
MAIKIDTQIDGMPELRRAFSKLPDNLQRRVLFKAIVRNTKVLEQKMKELAPVRDNANQGKSKKYPSRNHPVGYLRASIGTVKSRSGKYPTVWVRPRFKGKWDPWYEHFVMSGTANRKVAPVPFVDMAWDSVGAQVENGLKNDLEQMIQQEINRL